MNYSKFRFTLDIHKHQSQVSIPVMYGDTAVQLFITLSDGGMPYTIGKSCWAQFIANKPSVDEPLIRACIIEDGTTIRLDFDADIANVAGVYNCEVRLYGAEGILTSPCFTMVVDPRVTNSIGMDSGEATDLLDQIGLAMSQYKTAEEGRVAAEEGRVAAEEERVTKFGEIETDFQEAVDAFTYLTDKTRESIMDITLSDEGLLEVVRLDGSTRPVKEDTLLVTEDDLYYERLERSDSDGRIKRELQEEIEKQARRISNLEEHISDDYFVTDEAVAYNKAVPARACTYAKLASFGGMTYKCNNLFPYPYAETTHTQNGITFTDNGDGTFTANGTATGGMAGLQIYYKANNEIFEVGKTYSISDGTSNPIITGYYTYISATVNGTATTILGTHTAATRTYTCASIPSNISANFIIKEGTTVNNLLIKPMLNEGSTALPFEPWYEGLRDSKVTEIKSHGANMFNGSKFVEGAFSVRGITYSFDANTQIFTFNGTMDSSGNISQKRINLKGQKGSTYIIRTEVISGSATLPSGGYALVYFGSSDSITDGYTNWHDCSLATSQVKSKVLPHEYISNVWFYFTQGVVFNNLKVKIMLAETTDTTFPYKPYREPISYPIPAKIQAINGYGKDGFVIDLEKQTSAYEGSEKPLPVPLEPIIEVEGGGSLEFVNEFGNAVPSTVKYLLKEESSV